MHERDSDDTKPAVLHGERTVVALLRPCHRQWGELETTGVVDVRFCSDCGQTVVHVRTAEGAMQAAALGQCSYIEASESRGSFLGEMRVSDYQAGGPLVWED